MKHFKNSTKCSKMSKNSSKRLRKNIKFKKSLKKHYSPTLNSSKLTAETISPSMIIDKEDEEENIINLVPSSFILFDDDNSSIVNLYDFHEELESTKGDTENNFVAE